ncbi:CinA family protein [uncultured Brevundimonas sp.]|uniref:CinA family protein n=1 Tax=uncultured Brevundimonas sp. TaxID=213418 RepID=UPI002638D3AA|nr:CinA family protein [uncultured Brevundimonas sp.]
MFSEQTTAYAKTVLAKAGEAGLMVATAESCTGGLVAASLTEIAGSSSVVDRGFVTYSNHTKMQMLGVPEKVLADHCAVSEQKARAMATGAITNSDASVAVSITGIAGPGGGSAEKPVGLVHFAAARADGVVLHVERRFGDLGRDGVRQAALDQALQLLSDILDA